MKKEIIDALQKRYAVKTFDPNKKIREEDLKTILESGRLSPSSLGLEPWKFIVVDNQELRNKIRDASYNQTKVTDASIGLPFIKLLKKSFNLKVVLVF